MNGEIGETADAAGAGVERRFLGWDRPALRAAADILCGHYRKEDGTIRLDRAVVVLPGARAGRRLKELLLEGGADQDLVLVPPRVVTVGSLPELLYAPERPLADGVVARRVWAETLRSLPPERLAVVFPRRPDPDALTEWGGLAREVAGLQRDVAGAGLRFRDVAARCGNLHFDDFNRWEVLGQAQTEYEVRLAGLGFSDVDLARIDAPGPALAASAALDRDLWLVGVAQMPGVVRRMVERLAGEGQVVRALVPAPADRADGFDALGCVHPPAWLHAVIPVEDAHLSVQDRPEHQAHEVARTLTAFDGRYAAEEIVVGVPRREVAPYLGESLTDAGAPVHDAAGERVSASGPYRLLAAVADYLDGRSFESLAALTRHPDVGAWLRQHARATDDTTLRDLLAFPDGWLDSLDRFFCEHLPVRLIGGALPGRRGDRHRERVGRLLEHLDDVLGAGPGPARFAGTAGLSVWARAALELLHEVYGARSLDAGDAAHRRLAAALGAIADAAHALRRLPAELDARCTAAAGLRVLLDECGAATIPPDPERAAVELLGWLELHLDDAPVAVVTGVNEPDLPETVSAHAFLPDAVRAQLGLVDNAARYARDAYQLTALLRSRDHVRLIAGRRSAAGDPLRPSRLVLADQPLAVAARIQRFYDPERAPPPLLGDLVFHISSSPRGERSKTNYEIPGPPGGSAGAPPGFVLPPEPVLRAPEPVTRLRVTDFRALLEDPYSFALQRVLDLEPLDDAARELDGRGFGNLAHRVLERFGRSPHASATDPEVVFRALDALLDREAGRRFGRHVHVAVPVQVEQLRARLRRFARWHAGWIADGWEVRSAECATPGEGMAFDVDGEPVYLSARVDRIDYHPATETWAVFDYKTGDTGEDPERTHRKGRGGNKVWVDLQLPLYRRVLPSLQDRDGRPVMAGAPTGPVRLGYLLLPRDLEAETACFADWAAGELEEAEAVARDVVRRLRTEPFRFDRDAPAPRFADPRLEALLGRGQLTAAGDEAAGEEAGP